MEIALIEIVADEIVYPPIADRCCLGAALKRKEPLGGQKVDRLAILHRRPGGDQTNARQNVAKLKHHGRANKQHAPYTILLEYDAVFPAEDPLDLVDLQI